MRQYIEISKVLTALYMRTERMRPEGWEQIIRSRVRHVPSPGVVVMEVAPDEPMECYEGVRSQSVYDAIVNCRGKIVPNRLLEAVENGRRNGYLTESEYRRLKREVGK